MKSGNVTRLPGYLPVPPVIHIKTRVSTKIVALVSMVCSKTGWYLTNNVTSFRISVDCLTELINSVGWSAKNIIVLRYSCVRIYQTVFEIARRVQRAASTKWTSENTFESERPVKERNDVLASIEFLSEVSKTIFLRRNPVNNWPRLPYRIVTMLACSLHLRENWLLVSVC